MERHPRLHGGFIWEWRDHGLRTRTADGTEYFGYGGDFGEVVHDGNFVMDGMLLPDGMPMPSLAEFAHVNAPVTIRREGDALVVRNRQHSRSTEPLRFVGRLEVDGAVTVELPLVDAGIGPGATGSRRALGSGGSGGRPGPVPAGSGRFFPAGAGPGRPGGWRLRTRARSRWARHSSTPAPADNGGEGVPAPSSAQRWRERGLDRLVTRVLEVGVARTSWSSGPGWCRRPTAGLFVDVGHRWWLRGRDLGHPAGAYVERFSAPIDELVVDYSRPQESGAPR